MVKIPKLEDMLKAGMHFGHRTNRWHPKMGQFVFTSKNGIYIIDLKKTQEQLEKALEFMTKLVSEGKSILFVGTKNQVSEPLKKMAIEIGQPYIDRHFFKRLRDLIFSTDKKSSLWAA